MATKQESHFQNLSYRLSFCKAGLRWYMSHRKLELVATWTTSIAIVIGATYLGTQGATFVTAIGYGAVGLMNLEFARIIHYLSTTSLPPRDYQKEVDDYNDRKNRRNDD